MSKYHRIQTQLRNASTFWQAITDVCQTREIDLYHGQALALYDYLGRARPETAEYVIRRQYIGRDANDLGFHRRSDGTFEVIISEFDQHTAGAEIAREVKRRYARLQVEKLARARGLRVEEVEDNGVIRLRLHPTRSRQPVRAAVRR